MVLSNTFHLFLAPGPGADRALRRRAPLHALGQAGDHRLRRLPGLLDGPRRRSPTRSRAARSPARERSGAILGIDEEGVRFRSYVDGAERFMGPETSMGVQAALGSDIALVFDECLPFHVTRDYTARSTERTHRWLDRCLSWHERNGPRVAGRLRDRAGRGGGGPAPLERPGGRVARHVRARDRRHARAGQGADVRGRRLDDRGAAGGAPAPPARDRRRRRPAARRRARHRHVRLRDADADRPPRDGRRARPGAALARRPRQGPLPRRRRAAVRRLPLQRLRGGLLARLPALPVPPARDDRRADRDAAQPRLPAAC